MDNIILSLFGFFNWMLKTSLMASILVGLILLVKLVLKENLKVKWQYIMWFVLILRLILPWTPESSFSLFNLFSFMDKQIENSNISGIVQNDMILPNDLTVAEDRTLSSNSLGTASGATTGVYSAIKDVSWIYNGLLVAWIFGVFSFAMYLFFTSRKFAQKIKNGSYVTSDKIMSIFEKCKIDMRLKSNISLMTTNQIEGPTLYGLFSPKLLLPIKGLEDFSLNELRYIFLHELVHFKRKDILINWLMTGLLILHWFNPILWFAYKRMREDQELSCDAIAVSNIRSDEVKDYGYTLIKLLEKYSQTPRLPAVASFSANKSQLERRITMISLFKKNSYKWSILGLVTLLIISFLALTNAKAAPLEVKSNSNANSSVIPDKYVVLDGYYYVPNGDTIDELKLGKQFAGVQRIGDWEYKKTGDSNYFGPPAPIYSILDIKTDEKVAIKTITGGTRQNPNYTLMVLQRSEAIKEPDATTILGAKGDTKEVAIALQNIRKKFPLLYEFQGMEQKMDFASYSPNFGPGVKLGYRVPEADTADLKSNHQVQGIIFVYEYKKGMENETGESRFRKGSEYYEAKPTETFDFNWIHWEYYDTNVVRGEKDKMIYEVQVQGNLNQDDLVELLKTFKQNNK